MHPEVCKKLRAEVIAAVPTGAPSYEDIRGLNCKDRTLYYPISPLIKAFQHLVRACLNETLRLWSPVPTNQRSSVRASLLPSAPGSKPIFIPGGWVPVSYTDFLMHRRKDLWGPDAEVFDPERWIDKERLASFVADPFKFLPFNAGPRICLGQVGGIMLRFMISM